MKNEKLVTSAMLIAIGTVLSLICEQIPFLNLPFGGTVTLASMLPVILISYLYGVRWGLGSGFVYAVLQIAVGVNTVSGFLNPKSEDFMGFWIGLAVILLDYILAFTLLGLGGLFRNKLPKGRAIVFGGLLAMFLCYLSHVLSGLLFYGAWAEWFFTDTVFANFGVSKWIMDSFSGTGLAAVYSLIYNGCYMIPEMVITALVAVPVTRIPQIQKKQA